MHYLNKYFSYSDEDIYNLENVDSDDQFSIFLATDSVIRHFERESVKFNWIVDQAEHWCDGSALMYFEDREDYETRDSIMRNRAELAVLNAPFILKGVNNVPDFLFEESAVERVFEAMSISKIYHGIYY